MVNTIDEQLATRADLEKLELALKSAIEKLEINLKKELEVKIAETKTDIIKWVLSISFIQAAFIISCIKFIH